MSDEGLLNIAESFGPDGDLARPDGLGLFNPPHHDIGNSHYVEKKT